MIFVIKQNGLFLIQYNESININGGTIKGISLAKQENINNKFGGWIQAIGTVISALGNTPQYSR